MVSPHSNLCVQDRTARCQPNGDSNQDEKRRKQDESDGGQTNVERSIRALGSSKKVRPTGCGSMSSEGGGLRRETEEFRRRPRGINLR
jgi:hypothetical protein